MFRLTEQFIRASLDPPLDRLRLVIPRQLPQLLGHLLDRILVELRVQQRNHISLEQRPLVNQQRRLLGRLAAVDRVVDEGCKLVPGLIRANTMAKVMGKARARVAEPRMTAKIGVSVRAALARQSMDGAQLGEEGEHRVTALLRVAVTVQHLAADVEEGACHVHVHR